MSGNTPPAEAQQPANAPAFTQADIDKACATAVSTAVTAERTRTSGILAHKEAEGRTALAIQCVANGLTVEASGSMLAAAPKGTAAASPFNAAMAALGNPDVRAGEAGNDDAQPDPKVVSASWDKAFGVHAKRA